MWTSLRATFKLKQGKDENLADYYDKMKAFSSQVKKYLPNDVLHQFVESLEVYKKASVSEQLLMKQGGWKRLVAFGFLYNSDCEKYGKLLKDYKTDYANNLDHFPEDLVSMRERMSIACNEEKHQKKKEKEGKDKAKHTNSEQKVTFATSFAQVAKEKRYAGYAVEIIWLINAHTVIKSRMRNGTRIPWRRIIPILRMPSIIT